VLLFQTSVVDLLKVTSSFKGDYIVGRQFESHKLNKKGKGEMGQNKKLSGSFLIFLKKLSESSSNKDFGEKKGIQSTW